MIVSNYYGNNGQTICSLLLFIVVTQPAFLTIFTDIKSKLTPLELKLLERVEKERASMYVAPSSQQTDKERREAELFKRSEVKIL